MAENNGSRATDSWPQNTGNDGYTLFDAASLDVDTAPESSHLQLSLREGYAHGPWSVPEDLADAPRDQFSDQEGLGEKGFVGAARTATGDDADDGARSISVELESGVDISPTTSRPETAAAATQQREQSDVSSGSASGPNKSGLASASTNSEQSGSISGKRANSASTGKGPEQQSVERPTKAKRRGGEQRKRVTPDQARILESAFQENPRPERTFREHVAELTNLPVKNVKNRRARARANSEQHIIDKLNLATGANNMRLYVHGQQMSANTSSRMTVGSAQQPEGPPFRYDWLPTGNRAWPQMPLGHMPPRVVIPGAAGPGLLTPPVQGYFGPAGGQRFGAHSQQLHYRPQTQHQNMAEMATIPPQLDRPDIAFVPAEFQSGANESNRLIRSHSTTALDMRRHSVAHGVHGAAFSTLPGGRVASPAAAALYVQAIAGGQQSSFTGPVGSISASQESPSSTSTAFSRRPNTRAVMASSSGVVFVPGTSVASGYVFAEPVLSQFPGAPVSPVDLDVQRSVSASSLEDEVLPVASMSLQSLDYARRPAATTGSRRPSTFSVPTYSDTRKPSPTPEAEPERPPRATVTGQTLDHLDTTLSRLHGDPPESSNMWNAQELNSGSASTAQYEAVPYLFDEDSSSIDPLSKRAP